MKRKFKQTILQPLYRMFAHLPLVGRPLRYWRINRNFAVERQVLKKKHRNPCPHRSILFFTVHKAASSFIGGFMKDIVREAGMTPVDLDGYFFEIGEGWAWEESGRTIRAVPYQPTGYFYGPFRSLNQGIGHLAQYKIILVLRDPRDVIVSSYYSMYSHKFPHSIDTDEIQHRRKRRNRKLKQSVDEYVINKLNQTNRLLVLYKEYLKTFAGKDNVLLLKYEDMVTDFDAWLIRLTEFLDLDTSPGLIRQIKTSAGFDVDGEDITKHRRQVTPGEHKRKLKPETRAFLDKKLGDLLDAFEYHIETKKEAGT